MFVCLLKWVIILQLIWLPSECREIKPTIDTLEDIEAISYFLLKKYNYNKGSDNHEEDLKYSNRTMIAYNLINLFDFLRKGIHESIGASIDCDKEINAYTGSSNKKKLKLLCRAASKCQLTNDMLNLINTIQYNEASNNQETELRLSQSVVKLCPLMLFQLHDSNCTHRLKLYNATNTSLRPSQGSVWGFAILFVTIISFCSLIGVTIMPFIGKDSFQIALNYFEGLAVGSLVGSAIFHLIPQAFDLFGQLQVDDFLWKALIIFGGIYLFFWSERIMKIVSEYKRRRKMRIPIETNSNELSTDLNSKHVSFLAKNTDAINNVNDVSRGRSRSNSFTHKLHLHSHENSEENIRTIAWMIIFGDGLHNFIDGLSVGAAFSNSILSGISISVAVICEEFPHELGDFAVLISSGMTLREALGYNFVSACVCYVGMIFGIILGDFTTSSTYIFALAGGMFLYIALVDMMAELSAELDLALHKSSASLMKVMILQNLGMLTGISILFLLAKYSGHINFEGLVPLDHNSYPLLPA